MKKIFLKLSIIIACTLSLISNIYAQQNFVWSSNPGGISYDYGQSVAYDTSGNLYVAGYYGMSLQIDNANKYTSAGGSDLFVVKYDTAGKVIWSKSFGGIDADVVNALSLDSRGNIYVSGYFKSANLAFGSNKLVNKGGYDIFLAKLDNNGNVKWAGSYGDKGDDRAYGVANDFNGNVFITGFFASPVITFGSLSLTNTGALDVFLVKFDSLSVPLWAKSGTGTGFDYSYSLAVDKQGSPYICGSFNSAALSFGTTKLVNIANVSAFVAKYSAGGALMWACKAGINSDNVAFSLAVDTFRNCFVAGSFKGATIGFGTTVLSNGGNADIFVVKYDTAGRALWAKGTGGSLEDAAKAVSTDFTGNCYLAGTYRSQSITFGTPMINSGAGKSDVFITEFSPTGDQIWSSTFGSAAGDEQINSINSDLYGKYLYLGGYIGGNVTIEKRSLVNVGNTDVFVAKYRNK